MKLGHDGLEKPVVASSRCLDHVVMFLVVLQVGLFSLGIIPYINASIVLQLMSAAFPALKKMQREEGPQGRARFQYYQKLAAFVFAIAQVGGMSSTGPVATTHLCFTEDPVTCAVACHIAVSLCMIA